MASEIILKNLNIVKDKSKSCEIFTNEISDDFRLIKASSSSDYVNICWSEYEKVRLKYCKNEQAMRSINGSIFKIIIRTCLFRENIKPMFLQANVAFVPNVTYDLILFDEEKNAPIAISIKKSLRKKYKQADLEAVALKYVHRRAKSYLICLDKDKNDQMSKKIIESNIMGLDKIITANSDDFDTLINKLKSLKLITPPNVSIIRGTIVE